MRQFSFKNIIIMLFVIISSLSLSIRYSFAKSPEIKSTTKTQRMGGYVILINYVTYDKWTDRLVFKANCKFDEGELTFTSSSLNNIEQGWHKTEIAIPDFMKKRYGSLKEYKIELYSKGILVDTKSGY